ncbi:MAG: phage portal protein [Prevotellaceae bacterium]|jgi:lambda family phage portal protein|nr:phage portal protein [Prevotellaceae bacterium]
MAVKIDIGRFHFRVGGQRHRAYEAADKARRGKAFRLAKSTGANREIAGALVTLRDRSRHMARNNGWAKRAIEAIVKHTVGEGIQPAPIGTLDKTKMVKGLWNDWANSTACDWYEKTTFYGLQELAMRAIAEGGDVLVLKRWVTPDANNPVPLKLQLLEGDQLDHSKNGSNDKGVARLGVQYDKEGRLLGYWLFDYHPGDGSVFGVANDSRFVDKSEVLHAFEVLRIGQCRGLPVGVSSFMKMSDFSDYEDAQLMKQKVAACFAAFITGSDDKTPEEIDDLEPGVVKYLESGEAVEFSNPPSVSDYDAYSLNILRGIAAAYGITYEMLTMDYSRVNFTSGRMAKIDVTANFKSWQYNLLVPQLCAPVWQWFVDACLASGLLLLPVKAGWTAPRVQQLDPVKETDAQVTKIKAGLATISETIRETGREPGELYEEYKQDVERLKKLGLNVDSVLSTTAMPPAPADTKKPNEPGKKPDTGADANEDKDTSANKGKDANTDKNKDKNTSTNDDTGTGKDKKVPPAIEYGVGGTQSFIEMLINPGLTDNQKINTGVEWFGLTEEQMKKMIKK